jgi:OOP family OmpA-OmpF porin
VLGALLLIGALFAFGFFNFRSDEPLIEAGIRAEAGRIAQMSRHDIAIEVKGRDLKVTGLADTEDERDALSAALRAIKGRGRLDMTLSVIERMEPYLFSAQWDGESFHLEGGVPSEAVREALSREIGEEADALVLSSGAPLETWDEAARTGLRALRQLERGHLTLNDTAVTLSGEALTPARLEKMSILLGETPEGFTTDLQVSTLDDGTPLRLSAMRRAGETVLVQGKLPVDMAETWPEHAMALSVLPEPFNGWSSNVLMGMKALSHLRDGQLTVIGATLSLSGEAWSQGAFDEAEAALADMHEKMQVTAQIRLVDDGAPFSLDLVKTAAGLTASGKVPRGFESKVITALARSPVATQALTVVPVSLDTAWWDGATTVIEAMHWVETGNLRFDGTIVFGTVRVADPEAAAALNALMSGLPKQIPSEIEVMVIDDGTPQRLILHYDGKAATAHGKWPDALTINALSSALGAGVTEGEVTRTPKPAQSEWLAAAEVGLAALALLQEGELKLEGVKMSLSGTALSPAAEDAVLQRLASLPKNVLADTELILLDDGRPFAFEVQFDGSKAVLSGKVPADLGPNSQSVIMGVPVSADGLGRAAVPADADWWVAARRALKALALLENGRLSMDAHRIAITGVIASETQLRQIEDDLKPLGQDFRLDLSLVVDGN